MKTVRMLAILVLALALLVFGVRVSEAVQMGTAFTYQGHLYDANVIANGSYDLQFKLYDSNDPCDCTQIGDNVNVPDMDVVDGYFMVALDFNDASAFNGDARWLQIGVRGGELNDPNQYTLLAPRQEVTPTPYALQTRGLFVDGSGNVGIGATSPSARLHVVGSNPRIIIEDDSNLPTEINFRNVADPAWRGWALAKIGSTTVPSLGSEDDFIFFQNGTKVLIQKETGNMGIGTTDPDAKLVVNGDLKVTGAYKGDILSSSGSDGAPFPRPAYDSGWLSFSQGETKTLTHNIGLNVDNYFVDIKGRADYGPGIHNMKIGGDTLNDGRIEGYHWLNLTPTVIDVVRGMNDILSESLRVRIWVYH